MDLIGHKLIALFLSWILMAGGFLLAIPLGGRVIKSGEKGRLILDCCNSFGGGVFLGLFLLHSMPEVRHILEAVLMEPNDVDYPVPEILVGTGFFLIMLIELLAHEFIIKRSKTKINVHGSVPESIGQDKQQSKEVMSTSSKADLVEAAATGEEKPAAAEESKEQEKVDKLQLVVLLVALSIECVFEGMALGLMSDETGIWIMFAAIISHEVIIAFCLGMEFVKFVNTKWVFIYAMIYGPTAAVGIAIGIGISEGGSASNLELTQGIILGLAAGVFLYCTFLGIVNRQLKHGAPIVKYICVFAGFGLMCALAAIPHDHDHDHDHDH